MAENTNSARIILFVRIGISAIVLGVGVYVLLSHKFPQDYTKWATGMIGLVVGYWLR